MSDSDSRSEAIARALQLLDDGSALQEPAVPLGPLATPGFAAVLTSLGETPSVRVRCSGRCNGYRLAVWQLDAELGQVNPDHRPSHAWTGRAEPWLDRANAGKGFVEPGPSHDGRGTQRYTCPRCDRAVPLTAEERLRRFLGALDRAEDTVWI